MPAGAFPCTWWNFYPRPPRGGRPVAVAIGVLIYKFLSTPSARRATLPLSKLAALLDISIHALREEGDLRRGHGPRGVPHFYPRPPRGGRPGPPPQTPAHTAISIHALREEGDEAGVVLGRPWSEFLSTPSARRATQSGKADSKADAISIHALREEGDLLPRKVLATIVISIHALREEGDWPFSETCLA